MKRNDYFYREKLARRTYMMENDYTGEWIPYTKRYTQLSVMVDDRYCPSPMKKAMEFISKLYSINNGCWGRKDNDKPDGRDLYNIDKGSGFTINFNETYIRENWEALKEHFHVEVSDGVKIDSFYKFVEREVVTTKSRGFYNDEGKYEVEYYDEVNHYWECVRLFPLNWLKYDYKEFESNRPYYIRSYYWEKRRTRRTKLLYSIGKFYYRFDKPRRHRWFPEEWFHIGLGKREQIKQSTNTFLSREAQDEEDWWKGFDEYHNETTEMIWDNLEDEYEIWLAETNRESTLIFNTSKGKYLKYWIINDKGLKRKKEAKVPMNEYNKVDYKALHNLVHEIEVFDNDFAVWYGKDGQYHRLHPICNVG